MKVELVKNDQFFGASDVKLDGVEFSIITDSQTAAFPLRMAIWTL